MFNLFPRAITIVLISNVAPQSQKELIALCHTGDTFLLRPTCVSQ
jgi:hypothetical protein